MHSVTLPMSSLLVNGVHRFATLWKITRSDGTVFNFTDHDTELEFEGATYSPVGGAVSTSARQRADGTDPQNADVRGAITADVITIDDLRAGRYRDAVVWEYIVDWMQPWAGAFRRTKFIVQETVHDAGETWNAKLAGNLIRLQQAVGDTYTRTCRWAKLGNADCGVDVDSLASLGSVAAVSTTRLRFTSDVASTDEYFNGGYIEWGTGNNAGLRHEVKYFNNTGGDFELQLRTEFDIAPGDVFLAFPGCDRRLETCRDKFDNVLRFGGFPFIPGTDAMLSTPAPGGGG